MTSIQNIYIGKVRNSAVLDNNSRIVQTSNRISAFDFIFPFEIEKKAEILQALSVYYFQKTAHIIENNLIGCLNETHTLVKETKVFPIEIIVRGYLTGSIWRLYESKGVEGVYAEYAVTLPHGMQQNAKFSKPIITPTTKADGGHDLPISCARAREIIGKDNWDFVENKALELFEFGSLEAQKRNLVLVDTKYEMGIFENKIILVDEVHTPDSSRYWLLNEASSKNPKQLSKEFLREELIKFLGKPEEIKGNPANHPVFQDTNVTEKIANNISERYQEMFRIFVGDISPYEISKPNLIPWPISPNIFASAIKLSLMPENVLIIGNGGRDYSLFSAFAKLPEVKNVFCASGKRKWEHPKYRLCPFSNVDDIARYASDNQIGLVVAGPELPIAQGIQSACAKYNIPVLAPSLACAALESSKIICKEIIQAAGIKTAAAQIVTWNDLKNLLHNYLEINDTTQFNLPCVLKYDGLAAGKGVFVLFTKEDVHNALVAIDQNLPDWEKLSAQVKTDTYSKQKKSPCFLIEETLKGEEISAIALCNGNEFRLLPMARDYKRRNDGQTGANTGGMGSVSPVCLSEKIMGQIKTTFEKTLNELSKRNTPYRGFLFAGFMVDEKQEAWLLEYNCRLGDPETQVLLPGLQRDFYTELFNTAKGNSFSLSNKSGDEFNHDKLKRIFLVAASPEYPEKSAPRRELINNNLQQSSCEFIPTAIEPDSTTIGGRAFGLLASSSSFTQAQKNIYCAIENYYLKNSDESLSKPHFRTDIGKEFCETSQEQTQLKETL
ncbi:phosphoribosylaminoimidazolesuccinocarboxamide synthase [Fluviispira sanaruensis]|uniref:Phosphoribosylaminoimidazole-succinocarboxamide synthase n=1 Tax=Fluviispira sanaruensis TaxID=2493639 RepID=A0A4P2VJL7_FLUSA|nr:phosphoribosylaminoimidazolesuccinocarboxamide synthase [Fluviispira sanaruensis]BBH52718.1 phosphoribosylamine--glycine ligase [Fluviispira sanaruensis]